jgi:GntR family transcriptional regulator/MocR family aminotransferase
VAKRSSAVPFPPLGLDFESPVPVYRQIYENLREAILSGRLARGAQLPSTRTLAAGLGVSRTTVVVAFRQLHAEGYLEGRVGSGTYVACALPDDLLGVRVDAAYEPRPVASGYGLSGRGKLLATTPATTIRDQGPARAFRPGVPALEEFPIEVWRRLAGKVWRRPPRGLLGYGDPGGYQPLRETIANHLGAARAVRCTWEQVIVISGSQRALDLCARLLLDPGDAAWVEDPGYAGVRAALVGAGARLIPTPVDEEGLDITAGEAREPDARLVHVTPSHQYPLGVTMSLARRLALLEWASRSGAWILEDDYDSEYRYTGRPLEALQGLDAEGRVIYVGTFSKVLFPGLRLGYLVVPPGLVEAFVNASEVVDRHPPSVEQAILADFIAEGHFARHLRRTLLIYAERQQILLEEAKENLVGLLDVRSAQAGIHLVGWLPPGADDVEASRKIAARGVEAPPLASYSTEAPQRPGLILGYAAVGRGEIRRGVRRLAETLC